MHARRNLKAVFAVTVIQFVVASQVTANGLVGWWKFDEGKGETIADSSGHGNNGTVFGITSWVDGFVGPKALKIQEVV